MTISKFGWAQLELPVEGAGVFYGQEEEAGEERQCKQKNVTYFILFICQTDIVLISH